MGLGKPVQLQKLAGVIRRRMRKAPMLTLFPFGSRLRQTLSIAGFAMSDSTGGTCGPGVERSLAISMVVNCRLRTVNLIGR